MAATPPPDSGSGNEAPPVREPEVDALFRCLLHGDRNPVTVYNAIQEIKGMSGEVVVAKLSALIETRTAETTVRLTGLIETRAAETTSRLTELIEARSAEATSRLADATTRLTQLIEARSAENRGRLRAVEGQLRAIWGLLISQVIALVGVALTVMLR